MTNQPIESSPFDRSIARIAVGAYDDAQSVRQSMLNRVRDVIRKKNEGIPFDAVEEEKDEDERDYDAKYEDDNLPELIEEMVEEDKLSDHEYNYLREMLDAAGVARDVEERYKSLMSITEREPIYTEWLDNVYGVSTTLTARLLHTFGYCEERDRVSQIWAYSGLAPGQEPKRGEKLGYNPDAKTLAWIVADCMIKQGSRSQYREAFYDPYKEKQVNRLERAEDDRCVSCGNDEPLRVTDTATHGEDGPDVCRECWDPSGGNPSAPNSQGHADTRARRYLAKKFLKHYWYISRDLHGLETPDEWVVTHGGHDKRTDTFENPAYAKRLLADPHSEAAGD